MFINLFRRHFSLRHPCHFACMTSSRRWRPEPSKSGLSPIHYLCARYVSGAADQSKEKLAPASAVRLSIEACAVCVSTDAAAAAATFIPHQRRALTSRPVWSLATLPTNLVLVTSRYCCFACVRRLLCLRQATTRIKRIFGRRSLCRPAVFTFCETLSPDCVASDHIGCATEADSTHVRD